MWEVENEFLKIFENGKIILKFCDWRLSEILHDKADRNLWKHTSERKVIVPSYQWQQDSIWKVHCPKDMVQVQFWEKK